MDIPKEYYLEQLYSLRPTDENMKSLAIYIRTFKDKHQDIVDGIEYVYSKSLIHHRLIILYLINEILHTEKSESGVPLRSGLVGFLRKHFLADKELSHQFGPSLYKKFQQLQTIWTARKVVDFDEKYGLEEIISNITSLYSDKSKLTNFLDELTAHYRSEQGQGQKPQ